MTSSLPGSSREEADVTTPSQEGRPEMEAATVVARRYVPVLDDALIEEVRSGPKNGEDCPLCAEVEDGPCLYHLGYDDFPLAAVVVSSPATPAGCGCRAHSGHHTYCYDSCDQAGCRLVAGAFTPRASSPATPNGQGEEPECFDIRCRDCYPPAPPPASPADWSYTCDGCGWHTKDTRYEQHTCRAPSPAETREGREAAAWEEGFKAGGRWELLDEEWYEDSQSFEEDDLPTRPPKPTNPYAAASPAAVPLPEETEEQP